MGQVIGGRWKPLHYILKKTIFTDVIVACGKGGQCYIKNDAPTPYTGRVTVSLITLATGASTSLYDSAVNLPQGAGITQWFNVQVSSMDPTRQALLAVAASADGSTTACSNFLLYATPEKLVLPATTVQFKVTCNMPDGTARIDITTSGTPALYVVFTTAAAGRFSDNAFYLPASGGSIAFIPFGQLDCSQLTSTLRVEHLAQNQQ